MSYIRSFTTRKGDKEYTHYGLVSSYKDNGKVRQEFHTYLGTHCSQKNQRILNLIDGISKDKIKDYQVEKKHKNFFNAEKKIVQEYLVARLFTSQLKRHLRAIGDLKNSLTSETGQVSHMEFVANDKIGFNDLKHLVLDPRLKTEMKNYHEDEKQINFDFTYEWHGKPGKIKITIKKNKEKTTAQKIHYKTHFFGPVEANII